jgi:Pyruvate/2-oxoacid:ferredoxin oxidoreductase delta subunit
MGLLGASCSVLRRSGVLLSGLWLELGVSSMLSFRLLPSFRLHGDCSFGYCGGAEVGGDNVWAAAEVSSWWRVERPVLSSAEASSCRPSTQYCPPGFFQAFGFCPPCCPAGQVELDFCSVLDVDQACNFSKCALKTPAAGRFVKNKTQGYGRQCSVIQRHIS